MSGESLDEQGCSLDAILADLETLETFSPELLPEKILADATKSLVRNLAQCIESGATSVSYSSVLAAYARQSEGKPRSAPLDELILRFGKASILRMAKAREPNKAFGYLKDGPGNKPNPVRVFVQASLIGAYAEIERRSGRRGEAVLERAGARFGVSKNTARDRLELLAEKEGCSEIWKGLEAFFEDWTTQRLTAYLEGREDSD